MDQSDLSPRQGPEYDDIEAERTLLAELLESSRLYRSGKDYLEMLDFVSRLRNFAPFNAMLLQIQKPGLTYAASAYDWKTRFNRTINEGARPLLILWPFGPVALVFDVLDTDGDPLPADIARTFHAMGALTKEIVESYAARLDRRGIHTDFIEAGDANAGKIEVVQRSQQEKRKPDYQVRINANHDPNVQFVTLAHELGHLFLGHLGPDKYLKIAKRPALNVNQRELEAESLAYLVAKRRGVASKSESYLTDHVRADTTVDKLDIYQLLKSAGQVETTLGIAAETLFEPKTKRKAKQTPAKK